MKTIYIIIRQTRETETTWRDDAESGLPWYFQEDDAVAEAKLWAPPDDALVRYIVRRAEVQS